MGSTGPRWAPCWPHEPCYQGRLLLYVSPPSINNPLESSWTVMDCCIVVRLPSVTLWSMHNLCTEDTTKVTKVSTDVSNIAKDITILDTSMDTFVWYRLIMHMKRNVALTSYWRTGADRFIESVWFVVMRLNSRCHCLRGSCVLIMHDIGESSVSYVRQTYEADIHTNIYADIKHIWTWKAAKALEA